MDRPKISAAEIANYVKDFYFIITKNINDYLMRGQISANDASKYLENQRKLIEQTHLSVYAVAMRGYYKKMGNPTRNDIGIYDDGISLVGPNYFQTFNSNTDPSKLVDGKATLLPGLHFFKKGLHGHNRPTPAYKAFRDDNVDETQPVVRFGKVGIYQGQYINIHKGGEVYTNSAGCQTIRPEQYDEWQINAYKLLDAEQQRTFPYYLFEI